MRINLGIEAKKSEPKKEDDSTAIKKAKKFLEELNKFKRGNNCQKFAAALELRYRGIDVDVTQTARPDARTFDVPVGKASPYENWCLIKNAEFVKIEKDDPLKSVETTMLKWGEGSRAIIAVTWTGSHAGHVFNLTVIDGKVYLMDGTANRFKEIHDSDYLKNNIDADRSKGLLRSDKGSIDSQMKDDTFSDESNEFGLDPDEIKYPSVKRLLSVNGKQGKEFVIYRKGKKLGTVKCESIEHKYSNFSTVWNYKWI